MKEDRSHESEDRSQKTEVRVRSQKDNGIEDSPKFPTATDFIVLPSDYDFCLLTAGSCLLSP
jgi:hypothetical protein